MTLSNISDNQIQIKLKPTANRNCSAAIAKPSSFSLKGFCWKIDLFNSLGSRIDTKFLWVTGDLFDNWPSGDLNSDIAYFKPLILAKINQQEQDV